MPFSIGRKRKNADPHEVAHVLAGQTDRVPVLANERLVPAMG